MTAFKRQADVLGSLELRVRAEMRAMEEADARRLRDLWEKAQDAMRGAILTEYHHDFKAERWTLLAARQRGTLLRIERRTKELTRAFVAAAVDLIRTSKRDVWREETLRALWVIDMTTPRHISVKVPPFKRAPATEAAPSKGVAQGVSGEAARVLWRDRFSTWADAYHQTLNQNLKLGAMNASAADQAADEVEVSRPGSPAVSFGQIIDRILRLEVISSEVAARDQVYDANQDMLADEIWQTMTDGRVCDLCDSQNGLSRADVTVDMPAHPICRCFYRLVPKDWAELMRGADKDFARQLDVARLVPDAMVLFDDAGRPRAAVVVDFTSWRSGMDQAVMVR